MNKAFVLKLLYRSHVVVGLGVFVLFYISAFFGSLTYFMPYLKVWESPTRHGVSSMDVIDMNIPLKKIIDEHHFRTQSIDIIMPSVHDPLFKIASQSQNSLFVDPSTHQVFKIAREENLISTFFNELHTGSFIPIIGSFVMGLASCAIAFLIVGGIWIFFKKRSTLFVLTNKSPRKKWLSWHKYTGVFIVPYACVFALTGSFLGVMLSFSQPFVWSMTHAEETQLRKMVAPILFAQPRFAPSKEQAEMLPLSVLHDRAKRAFETLEITSATWHHYGTSSSKVTFKGYDKTNSIITGRSNRLNVTVNASNGDIVEEKKLEQSHWMNRFLSAFYFVHFVPDENLAMRLILGSLGILFCFTLVSGYMIWAEKKVQQNGWLADIIHRIFLALIFGIVSSSALVMLLHWMLPMDLFDKEMWIKGAFFAMCSFWLFLSVFERSIVVFLQWVFQSTAFFLGASVFFHDLKTHHFIWESFVRSEWVIFWVDMTLVCLAVLFYYGYRRLENSEWIRRYENKGVYYGF